MLRPVVEHRWTLVQGRPLFARIVQSPALVAPPSLIMVHGLGVASRYMLPTALRLADSYRVVIPDLPGFGHSAKPDHVLNMHELAAALVEWMDALAIERAMFLGNSLGCQIIVDLAVNCPQRATRLVLVGPTIDAAARTVAQQFGRLMLDWPRERLSLTFIHGWDDLLAGPRWIIQTLRHALADDIEAHLPLVTQPTLVVRGSRDPVAPQRWAETVTRCLPDGRLVVVPGAPHAVNYSCSHALATAVQAFLAANP